MFNLRFESVDVGMADDDISCYQGHSPQQSTRSAHAGTCARVCGNDLSYSSHTTSRTELLALALPCELFYTVLVLQARKLL